MFSLHPTSTRQASVKTRGAAAPPTNSSNDGANGGTTISSPTAAPFQPTVALQSPCFVHSYLDSGLGAFRSHQDTSYFDPSHQQPPLPAAAKNFQRDASQQPHDRQGQEANYTSDLGRSLSSTSTDQDATASASAVASTSSVRQRRPSARPQPMHRGMRGAVEPDSDNEDGSGSGDGSESGSTSQGESDSYVSSEDDDVRVRSLTRQLAETAVGVREMSKQLGRARVKSRIQSVLIITKARDNHLIKLTRELAIWLMTTPRNDREYGLTVYVDSQLRQSKRFDAEGIRRDHPQIFSVSSMSASALRRTGDASNSGSNESSTADVADLADKSGQNSATGSRKGSISNGRTNGEENLLRYWTSDMCSRSPHLFDFVVTLGGDGTVLFCSWLFQRIVPPVMPFALGSLGFLTNFDFKNYQKYLKSALDTGIRVNLRMRFTATVYRVTHPINATLDKRRRRAIKSGKTGEIIMKTLRESGWESIEKPLPQHHDLRGGFTEGLQGEDSEDDDPTTSDPPKKDKEIMCFSTRPVETFEVLNDLVVDRGPSPYVSLLEVFGDEHHLTTAQADGLCISTPTGSTAYSLSAGGSLVHPEIPAILISPICPHTLSFRPMLLPDSMELRIAVPYNSRSTAWASFDGRGRVELKQGDHIKVTASKYPFPTVCADNQSSDWFESISRTLKWNERQRQKSFVVVEEGDEGDPHEEEAGKSVSPPRKDAKAGISEDAGPEPTKNGHRNASEDKSKEPDDYDEADDDAEEDEKFDIDDSSTVATRANSPDATLRRRHSTMSDGRHHHHHHDRHRTRSSNGGSSSNSSSSTSLPFSGLKPMTSLKPSSHNAEASEGRQQPLSAPSKVSFDEGPGQLRSQGRDRYQYGVVHASNRSVLDSPDRFGLAGPPGPPRALSERHLASADFRLDESQDPDEQKKQPVTKEGDGSARAASALDMSAAARDPATVSATSPSMDAGQLRNSIVEVAESNAKIASGSNRLYRKLKGRSSSRAREGSSRRRSSGEGGGEGLHGGFELGRTDSRKANGGAALVVYGQDESDSDSTAEG